MLRKPWPIIMLTMFFICVPFINLFYTYFFLKSQTTLSNYFYSLIHIQSNYISVFNMMAPALVSAFAIYSVKKWSYPVLLCCITWLGVNAFLNFSMSDDILLLMMVVVLPMVFNIVVVSYFLIPSVKTTYYEPRVRWWEAKPRYVVSGDAHMEIDNQKLDGKVTNISEGGVFFVTGKGIEIDSVGQLEFEVNKSKLQFKAKAIFKAGETFSYGMKFEKLDASQAKALKDIIKELKESKAEICRPIPLWDEDLKKWFFDLLKTGRGLTPPISKEFQKVEED